MMLLDFNGAAPQRDEPVYRPIPEKDVLSRVHDLGIMAGVIHYDGEIYRCGTIDKPESDNAWIMGFEDRRGVVCGDWAGGWKEFVGNNGNKPSLIDMEKVRAAIVRRKQRDDERAKVAAARAERIYTMAKVATAEHQYLVAKGVGVAHGVRQSGAALVIPAYTDKKHTSTLQFISTNKKTFLKHGKIGGCFFPIQGDHSLPLYIAEGYATAYSVHMATKATVLVAFNSGNLSKVAVMARVQHPTGTIIIAGDNDLKPDGSNPGRAAAIRAAGEAGGMYCLPSMGGLKCDYNDLHQAKGLEEVRRQIYVETQQGEYSPWDNPVDLAAILNHKPPKQRFLFTERMPQGRGVVVTGVGGSSKTTIVKQMAIAAVLGRNSFGWTTETRGKAVLMLTEDTVEDVHRSIYYMAEALELTNEERAILARDLIIYPMAGKETRLLVKGANNKLVPSGLHNSMIEKIRSLGNVVFVGIDPALAVTDGDELDQGEQRTLGKLVDDMAVNTGATTVLVTHATKGSQFKDELSSHNSRGGGAITDAVRAEISLRTMTAEEGGKARITDIEERKRHVQMVVTKANGLPPAAFVPVWLRRDNQGILHVAEIEVDDSKLTKENARAVELLREKSIYITCTLKEWREACKEENLITGDNPKAIEQSMARMVKKLINLGMIKKGYGKGIYTVCVFENE